MLQGVNRVILVYHALVFSGLFQSYHVKFGPYSDDLLKKIRELTWSNSNIFLPSVTKMIFCAEYRNH